MSDSLPSTGSWLLYDGDCSFCARWVNWAIRRGAAQAVAFLPCQDAIDVRSVSSIDEADCAQHAIFVQRVDGKVTAVNHGAAAVSAVLAQLPGARHVFLRLLGNLYWVPIIKQIEEAGYRFIAGHRHWFAPRSCNVGPRKLAGERTRTNGG